MCPEPAMPFVVFEMYKGQQLWATTKLDPRIQQGKQVGTVPIAAPQFDDAVGCTIGAVSMVTKRSGAQLMYEPGRIVRAELSKRRISEAPDLASVNAGPLRVHLESARHFHPCRDVAW